MALTKNDLQTALKKYFGFSQFKGLQEGVIEQQEQELDPEWGFVYK